MAIPEFDGRIIGPAFSFKEVVDDGDQLGLALSAHRAIRDRLERVAGLAVRLARLRHLPPAAKRVAVVLSAYPTKRSRIDNAVALDAPASLLVVLDALRAAGDDVAEVGDDSDAVMARLADGLTYDVTSLSPAQERWPPAGCTWRTTRTGSPRYPSICAPACRRPGAQRRARCACTTTTSCSPASTSGAQS
ncbi:MAG: cobaltochelatase subunit CobN [Acidimicrobiales bacterium]